MTKVKREPGIGQLPFCVIGTHSSGGIFKKKIMSVTA